MSVQLLSHETAAAARLIATAFEEDLCGSEDLTSVALIPADATGYVNIVARQPGTLCGNPIARMVFSYLDGEVQYESEIADSTPVQPGDVVARLHGPLRSLLVGERTALNFLTLLSGTATLTRAFLNAVAGTNAKILDTRKTLPGLRALQRYAVRCGGGENHRSGLHDAVLIKDNHLAWWTSSGHSLAEAVKAARERTSVGTVVEIEVDSLKQLQDVLPAQPDIVLLDNMTCAELWLAVAERDSVAPQVKLEASGGVNLHSVRSIAETGVDRISIGALTHSASALDLGFDWE